MAEQAATDSLIAQLLAQDRICTYDDEPESEGHQSSDSSGSGGGMNQRRAGARRKRSRVITRAEGPSTGANCSELPQQSTVPEGPPAGARRQRNDVGKQRAAGRPWNDQEECLFLQALELHGRNWKACADFVSTRDCDAVKSHAQRHFIKLCLKGKLLPTKVAESGTGYTLSGNMLDPESAGAVQNGFKMSILAGLSTDELEVAKKGLLLAKLPASLGGDSTAVQQQVAKPSTRPQRPKRTTPLGLTSAASTGSSRDQPSSSCAREDPAPSVEACVRTDYALARPKRHLPRQQLVLAATTESQLLVQPLQFIGQPGSGAPLAQPFEMKVHAQALAVADIQARLSSCEIIGLLGGSWNPGTQLLTVTEAYPCRCAAGSEATNAVELDPVAEVEVRAMMEAQGQRCVGWYHSHPVFEPRPSQKDMENQRNYQALFRDADAQTEPFVGLIVGPYNEAMLTPASVITAFLVQQRRGALDAYSLKFSLTGTAGLPSQEATFNSKLTHLLDMFCGSNSHTIDLAQQWRPYTYITNGHPTGPAITKMEALQVSLMQFMPEADPMQVQVFVKTVAQRIYERRCNSAGRETSVTFM